MTMKYNLFLKEKKLATCACFGFILCLGSVGVLGKRTVCWSLTYLSLCVIFNECSNLNENNFCCFCTHPKHLMLPILLTPLPLSRKKKAFTHLSFFAGPKTGSLKPHTTVLRYTKRKPSRLIVLRWSSFTLLSPLLLCSTNGSNQMVHSSFSLRCKHNED